MDIFSKSSSTMVWSLEYDQLAAYTAKQLSMFSSNNHNLTASDLQPYMRECLHRVEHCLKNIRRKYFFDGKNTIFNHLHSDQYAIYLYFLSHTIFCSGENEELSLQLFLLNKALHGADIFSAIKLPEVFLLIHPVGTVLGNAYYGNYFAAYQNCAVGSLEDGIYPVFEGETVLFSGATVLGNCHIGKNVVFAANSFILNSDIPSNSTVVGAFPNHRMLPIKIGVIDRIFHP